MFRQEWRAMSNAMTEDFLSGQGIAVDPRRIEAQLDQMWGPAAEEVAGPEVDHPGVTRIVLANLVVAGSIGEDSRIDDVLDVVVARYPCRTIVLRPSDAPERKIDAEVSALCHLPAPGRPQVCSERIVLKAGPNAVDLLPGAVRPLLESDLPFVLWWTGDPRQNEPLFRSLAGECSRLLIGLPDPDGDPKALRAGLDPQICRFGHDIAWFGITLWRGLVAQFFDHQSQRAPLRRIRTVEIETIAPRIDRPGRVSVWLGAWLAGQLGWKPRTLSNQTPGTLVATFDPRPSGGTAASKTAVPITLTIKTTVDSRAEFARIQKITIVADGSDRDAIYRLSRPDFNSPEVEVEVDSCDRKPLPSQVLAPELDTARRLSAALESSRDDPPFARATPIALWLLGA